MRLTLNLTSEIEQYLSQKATEKGISLDRNQAAVFPLV